MQIALGVDVKRTHKEIVFHRWEPVPGATRSSPDAPAPQIVQAIVVMELEGDTQPRLWGTPLIVPFEKLLLRPRAGAETDIELTASELATLARKIWDSQGF